VNILVVENHEDTLHYLRIFLRSLGYQVRSAGTMTQALADLAGHPCDILVSDIGLPDGDGWQLLEQAALPPSVYTIAMSGFGMGSDQSRSKAVGYHHHLVKPFTPEQLQALIEEGLRRRAQTNGHFSAEHSPENGKTQGGNPLVAG
jgi:two-component system CheB/CheR fusion protein